MFKIKYKAEDAKVDMYEFNHSLDKDLEFAERLIKEAAQRGYSGCSLSDTRVEHWSAIEKELKKLGYEARADKERLTFNVFWDKQFI